MAAAIDPDLKAIIFRVIVPVYMIGFYYFSGFVQRRLPEKCLVGWKLFTIGGFVSISGLAVAAYFGAVELGAGIVLLGVLLAGIGMAKLFVGKRDASSN